jgi:anhydro-N-acetylmuramic acid kinase
MNTIYTATGIMSGTSCDGLDLAFCEFWIDKKIWKYKIANSSYIPYDKGLSKALKDSFFAGRDELMLLDIDFGRFIGDALNGFHKSINKQPSMVSSHGHTVFHRPFNGGYSLQIGSGATIAALTGIDTVCNFRNLDIALGGQGAPLVPIGDRELFSDYAYCLNLGGIANISFEKAGNRVAYDICPVNMALNELALLKGVPYDNNGAIAATGVVDDSLLDSLENLEYYHQSGPKSIGREWYEAIFKNDMQAFDIPVEDKMATVCEHAAMQIAGSLDNMSGNILVTGGGTHNKFLVNKINEHIEKKGCTLFIPNHTLINFKEALIFAFLGVLRKLGKTNTLASVTGAKHDSSGGSIFNGSQ